VLKRAFAILSLVFKMAIVILIGFGISMGVSLSIIESTRFPSEDELKSLDNISNAMSRDEARAVSLSRHSIVQVLSANKKSVGFSKMSGTYIAHQDKFYILTAAHGIMGECDDLVIANTKDALYECIRYIIIDKWTDYAIIEVEEVLDRIPVKLSAAIPSNREWKEKAAVLSEVFYTGYPNSLGPLTFRGAVAGLSPANYIYLHSYAWPGSSGAGVFSTDGHLIGIVIALNVGLTGAGYDVLEDLVIITPLFMIDWETAYQIMEESSLAGDTGE